MKNILTDLHQDDVVDSIALGLRRGNDNDERSCRCKASKTWQ